MRQSQHGDGMRCRKQSPLESYMELPGATESHWKQLKKAVGATFTCQINRALFCTPWNGAAEWAHALQRRWCHGRPTAPHHHQHHHLHHDDPWEKMLWLLWMLWIMSFLTPSPSPTLSPSLSLSQAQAKKRQEAQPLSQAQGTGTHRYRLRHPLRP